MRVFDVGSAAGSLFPLFANSSGFLKWAVWFPFSTDFCHLDNAVGGVDGQTAQCGVGTDPGSGLRMYAILLHTASF